jgi:small subunit ribosomal protein S8
MTDPISDMLTRIRNAIMVQHDKVSMPSSKIKVAITLIIRLKYLGDRKHQRPVITGLKRVSKPGRRIYTPVKTIPWVLSGMGIAVLSTPKGVITGQQARRLNVGGEIICYVW